EAVRAAVAGLQDTELERAQALWQRRYGQVASTPAELAKQMRFLAGRGFSGEVIRRVVRGHGLEDAFDLD
ncbi:MAG: RecX family transcriptional regulator, partial [Pseudomonadota bacterium]